MNSLLRNMQLRLVPGPLGFFAFKAACILQCLPRRWCSIVLQPYRGAFHTGGSISPSNLGRQFQIPRRSCSVSKLLPQQKTSCKSVQYASQNLPSFMPATSFCNTCVNFIIQSCLVIYRAQRCQGCEPLFHLVDTITARFDAMLRLSSNDNDKVCDDGKGYDDERKPTIEI